MDIWVKTDSDFLLFADSNGDLSRCNFHTGKGFSGRCQKPSVVEEVTFPKFDRLVYWSVKLLSNSAVEQVAPHQFLPELYAIRGHKNAIGTKAREMRRRVIASITGKYGPEDAPQDLLRNGIKLGDVTLQWNNGCPVLHGKDISLELAAELATFVLRDIVNLEDAPRYYFPQLAVRGIDAWVGTQLRAGLTPLQTVAGWRKLSLSKVQDMLPSQVAIEKDDTEEEELDEVVLSEIPLTVDEIAETVSTISGQLDLGPNPAEAVAAMLSLLPGELSKLNGMDPALDGLAAGISGIVPVLSERVSRLCSGNNNYALEKLTELLAMRGPEMLQTLKATLEQLEQEKARHAQSKRDVRAALDQEADALVATFAAREEALVQREKALDKEELGIIELLEELDRQKTDLENESSQLSDVRRRLGEIALSVVPTLDAVDAGSPERVKTKDRRNELREELLRSRSGRTDQDRGVRCLKPKKFDNLVPDKRSH